MLGRKAMRTSGAAGLGTIAERLINDGLDGARATAALGATTETTVDLFGVAGKFLRALDGTADIVVGKHVAGTDDHYDWEPVGVMRVAHANIEGAREMQKKNRRFEAIPN